MLKRLLFALCLLLVFPVVAYADIIIEPDNDFYTRHRSECTYLYRSFYANGEQGFVSVKEAPGSKKETMAIENGEVVHIMFTYSYQGEVWGVTEIYAEDRTNGWIPLSQLLLVYDYISFAEEHQEEFYTYTGSYAALYEMGDLVFWAWPGSGEIVWTLEEEWRNSETDHNFLEASQAYKDSEGREWGFFSYVYGNKNSWACLSDPANANIPAFNPAPQPELWQPASPDDTKGGLSAPLLAVVLVAVAVGGSMILIRVFWKRN